MSAPLVARVLLALFDVALLALTVYLWRPAWRGEVEAAIDPPEWVKPPWPWCDAWTPDGHCDLLANHPGDHYRAPDGKSGRYSVPFDQDGDGPKDAA